MKRSPGHAMQDAQVRHYRFGPFRLDLQTRELRRGGTPVVLTAKAFDVLRQLVENRDRVVARDELLETVWAGRVVEENNLTQAIAALRRAFGTGAGDHSYIVTVPGRGYRFVAEVEDACDGGGPGDAALVAATPAPTPTPSMPPPVPAAAPGPPVARAPAPARIRRRLLPGLGLLAAAAAAAWLWPGAEPVAPPPPPPAAERAEAPLTLAVLPFLPLSPGQDDGLLGLGLADTLITRVSGAGALRVQPLSSSQRFSGVDRDPVEVARRLGVAYVVEGTTQRHGGAIKVNARLLSADGRALWSGSFDAPADRVFTLQDDIADALARALAVRVPASARRSPCDGADPEAYRAYLSGQYRISRPSADSGRQALADFRRALDLDPTCARVYAAMAQAYRAMVASADAEPRENFARASSLVDRALALDPNLPEAHLARAWIQFWYDWDWAASEASFKRAIELNPSLADAYFGYAHLLANIGREAEAAELARMAMALDPLSPVINAIGGWFVAPPQEVGRYMERALEVDPDYWLALLMRGAARVSAGDRERGLADIERARGLCGGCSHALAVRGLIEARAGNHAAARRILREMEARDREGYWPASSLATLHGALGETEAALDLLERAWRERDVRMVFLRVDERARWQGLRDQPRYQALVRRMGFADAGATMAADAGVRTGASP